MKIPTPAIVLAPVPVALGRLYGERPRLAVGLALAWCALEVGLLLIGALAGEDDPDAGDEEEVERTPRPAPAPREEVYLPDHDGRIEEEQLLQNAANRLRARSRTTEATPVADAVEEWLRSQQ